MPSKNEHFPDETFRSWLDFLRIWFSGLTSSQIIVCVRVPVCKSAGKTRNVPLTSCSNQPPWLRVNIWKIQTLSFPDLYTCARTLERVEAHPFFFRPGIGLETLGSVKNRAIHPRSSDFRPHFADYSKSRDLPAVIHGYSSLAQEATTRLWWIDKSATWWTQTPCARRS